MRQGAARCGKVRQGATRCSKVQQGAARCSKVQVLKEVLAARAAAGASASADACVATTCCSKCRGMCFSMCSPSVEANSATCARASAAVGVYNQRQEVQVQELHAVHGVQVVRMQVQVVRMQVESSGGAHGRWSTWANLTQAHFNPRKQICVGPTQNDPIKVMYIRSRLVRPNRFKRIRFVQTLNVKTKRPKPKPLNFKPQHQGVCVKTSPPSACFVKNDLFCPEHVLLSLFFCFRSSFIFI